MFEDKLLWKMNSDSIHRVVLFSILISVLIYSFTGEYVPHNEGAGWDGVLYFEIIKNFEELLMSKGIDAYHMTRFLPFAVLHYVLSWLNIPLNIHTAIIGMRVFNVIAILLLCFYFFRLSSFLHWSKEIEIVAFSFCFFNFYLLKNSAYYPITCDCIALLLSYMGLYYYIKRNKIGQFIVFLLSLLTWPILSAVMFVLILFPDAKVKWVEDNSFQQLVFAWMVKLSYILFPTFYGFYLLWQYGFFSNEWVACWILCGPDRGGIIHPYYVVFSIIAISFFFYFATKSLNVNWINVCSELLKIKVIARILLGGIIFYTIYQQLQLLGGPAVFSVEAMFKRMIGVSASDCLLFLETHFMYMGLFFLLILLLWEKIVIYSCETYGIPYLFVLMMALLFSIGSETRGLIQFYPFLLVPLIACLNKIEINKVVLWSIPFICLVTSFFWLHINIVGIQEAFERPIPTYIEFPAQRYYMFFGPWQSHYVYCIVSCVEISMIFAIRFMYKKGTLTT